MKRAGLSGKEPFAQIVRVPQVEVPHLWTLNGRDPEEPTLGHPESAPVAGRHGDLTNLARSCAGGPVERQIGGRQSIRWVANDWLNGAPRRCIAWCLAHDVPLSFPPTCRAGEETSSPNAACAASARAVAEGMLTFAAAVFFLIITPGPGVLSTAGVGSAYGYRAGVTYVVGLMIGTNLVTLAVVSGLAAVLLADDRIRTVLLWASAAYLAYLAFRIAFAGAKIAFIHRATAPGIVGGLLLQAINPKAYAVNTTLFTGFPFEGMGFTAEIIVKLLIVNVIWLPIHLGWLWAGVALHQLNLSPKTQRRINVVMALSMLAVVALAAFAQRQ